MFHTKQDFFFFFLNLVLSHITECLETHWVVSDGCGWEDHQAPQDLHPALLRLLQDNLSHGEGSVDSGLPVCLSVIIHQCAFSWNCLVKASFQFSIDTLLSSEKMEFETMHFSSLSHCL